MMVMADISEKSLKFQTKIVDSQHRIWVKCAAIARGDKGENRIVAVWNSATQESAQKEFDAYKMAYIQSQGNQSQAADAILSLRMTQLGGG